MQYLAFFGDRVLALPAMCRTFPIGQHLSPYLAPNHTPIQLQDQKRAPLAEGMGHIANSMAKEWMIRFLKDAEFKNQPLNMSDTVFVKLRDAYKVFESMVKEQRKDSLAQIYDGVAILSTLMQVDSTSICTTKLIFENSNVNDTQVQCLIDNYLVMTVNPLLLERWQQYNISDTDEFVVTGDDAEDWMWLVEQVADDMEVKVNDLFEDTDNDLANWVFNELNMLCRVG